MNRYPQLILVVCTLANCWLGMQIVHELGHVSGAWWTGAVVEKVVLRPWTLSRTQLGSNTEPMIVAWAGPAVGVALPLAAWLGAGLLRLPALYLLRFFAGFCLVANGAYLGGGALDRLGDAGDLQRYGSPLWQPLFFGAVTVPLGLWLWHGQGQHFGFGGAGGQIHRPAMWASAFVLVLLVVGECLLDTP